MDGVGPRDERPAVQELAWNSTEPNWFGTDEYIKLCQKMNWLPMLTVNLGTGTPEEACNWLAYCNTAPGTKYADLRVANGSARPYGVKLWCLGNEMDGPWQLGHVPADQYAIRAQQAAKMMRGVDNSIELVACGSSNPNMPTFIEWDRQVPEVLGDLADYVSLHRYVGNLDNDTPDYLAITNSIDRQIEEVYNLEDALVVAGFLNSFIRHADVIKIANLAQIVNVIAPILTRGDEMLIQSIFYPFEMFSQRREGVALRPAVHGPTYRGKANGQVHYVDTSAILNGDRLHVFATNRSLDEPARIYVKVADRPIVALDSAELLTGPDAKAANSFELPGIIRARPFVDANVEVKIAEGVASLALPALSVAAMTFTVG